MPVALITGSGRGLGAALAIQMADLGYDVALHYYQSESAVGEVQKKISDMGREAVSFKANLSQPSSAKILIDQVQKQLGQLDVLINNAGTFHPLPHDQMTEEAWMTDLHSSVTAAFFVTQAALPLLRKSECGRIVNIGDAACDSVGARKLGLAYHISKTGIHILTRSLAATEIQHGVTVNLIAPGIMEHSTAGPAAEDLPSSRRVSFDDILHALRFLISPAAAQITGTNIIVSGGWNLK